MSNEQASTWRELWSETTALLGDEKEARWLCEEASGLEGSEFLESLNDSTRVSRAEIRVEHHVIGLGRHL